MADVMLNNAKKTAIEVKDRRLVGALPQFAREKLIFMAVLVTGVTVWYLAYVFLTP